MAAMIRLSVHAPASLCSVLPDTRNLAGWHQALVRDIAIHLSPEHAAALATPVAGDTGPAWFAPGNAMRRFDELDAADRKRLTTAAGSILSDIRRLAESGKSPVVTASWPALRTVPDLTHLFAVDGRPVLAGWGFTGATGGTGPLAAFDDGVAWRRPPRLAWPAYGGALAMLAMLALAAGFLLVPLGVALVPLPVACHVTAEQLALLREQSQEAARSNALRAQLAQLQEAHGERALQCPIPREVVPPPQPHADLPADRWAHKDVGILEECWNSTTPLGLQEERTHQPYLVKSWVYCFDSSGDGHQKITLDNGDQCDGNLLASFDSVGELRMQDVQRCQFHRFFLRRGQVTCQRDSDTDATCDRRDLEGPAQDVVQTGKFQRSTANDQH